MTTAPPPWLQLEVRVARAQATAVEAALLAAGAVSVSLQDPGDDPVLEPGVGETPLWTHIRATGLFNPGTDTAAVMRQLAAGKVGEFANGCWQELPDQDWERSWMADWLPIRCGERLWICPSWCTPPDAQAINLILDPGLAFGSGTHPTTFLCLQWLDGQPLAGKTVVDYGCGSGILGIAALLLGAAELIAVDNDPQALLATTDNGLRNGIGSERLQVCTPSEVPPGLVADMVLANILAAPLIELAPRLSALLRAQGSLCLSGIMVGQQQAVMSAYRDSLAFAAPNEREGWVQLTGRKRST